MDFSAARKHADFEKYAVNIKEAKKLRIISLILGIVLGIVAVISIMIGDYSTLLIMVVLFVMNIIFEKRRARRELDLILAHECDPIKYLTVFIGAYENYFSSKRTIAYHYSCALLYIGDFDEYMKYSEYLCGSKKGGQCVFRYQAVTSYFFADNIPAVKEAYFDFLRACSEYEESGKMKEADKMRIARYKLIANTILAIIDKDVPNLEKAIKELDPASSYNINVSFIYYLKGRCAYALGDIPLALGCFINTCNTGGQLVYARLADEYIKKIDTGRGAAATE